MKRPYKNIQAFKEVKRALNSNYLEYKRLSETQEDPHKLEHLITVISNVLSVLTTMVLVIKM